MNEKLKPGDRVSTDKGEKGLIVAIDGGLANVRLDSSLRKRIAVATLTKIADERIHAGGIYRLANGQIIKPLEQVGGKWKVQLWYSENRRWGDSPMLIESRYIKSEVESPEG